MRADKLIKPNEPGRVLYSGCAWPRNFHASLFAPLLRWHGSRPSITNLSGNTERLVAARLRPTNNHFSGVVGASAKGECPSTPGKWLVGGRERERLKLRCAGV